MLRVIGDVHGCVDYCRVDAYDAQVRRERRSYLNIINEAEYSVQLGDVGFSDAYSLLKGWMVDPAKHKFIQGNHDDYDNPPPHILGDFGIATHGGITFGFIRGEKSVDQQYRKARQAAGYPQTWWEQEEFTVAQADACIEFFSKVPKLDIMLAHGCPHKLFSCGILTNEYKLEPSYQSRLLTVISETVKIKSWIFGHHHHRWRATVEGTNYICLQELTYLDISDDGSIGQTI